MGNIGGLSGSSSLYSLGGLGSNADIIANLAGLGLNNNLNLNNLAALTGNNSDTLSPREWELNPVGLSGFGWRVGRLVKRSGRTISVRGAGRRLALALV
jgi:hypothetical protein